MQGLEPRNRRRKGPKDLSQGLMEEPQIPGWEALVTTGHSQAPRI